MKVSHIHSTSAQQGYNELLTALGSENNPSQWLVFMNTAKQHLPFLFESGRPTRQQIEISIIGQLGFASWSEMIETDQDKQGLSWSVNSWKQWSKAYKVVLQHSYLTEMNLTASAVMTLQSLFKDIDFPANAEELEQAKAAIAEKKKSDEAEKVSSLKARVLELEKELIAANAKIEVLNSNSQDLAAIVDSVTQLKAENAILSTKCEQLQFRSDELEHDARVSKTRYESLKKHLFAMTLWQRIRAEFNI